MYMTTCLSTQIFAQISMTVLSATICIESERVLYRSFKKTNENESLFCYILKCQAQIQKSSFDTGNKTCFPFTIQFLSQIK